MREPGYYWVKQNGLLSWEVAFWSGQYWYIASDDYYYSDDSFQTINETRILNPDEVKEQSQK